MKRVLQHEGFHQFASHLFPKLPTWANEGLAEVFERGVAMNGTIVLGEVTAADRQRLTAAAAANELKPFSAIFTTAPNEWGHQVRQGNAGLNYLQAWSMAHFFLYAEQGKYQQQFLNFLVALNRGVSWEQAFVASFGTPDFSVLENLWRQHISTVAATDFRETIRRLDFLAAGMLALREQDIYVESLDQLREHLQEIKFTHESDLFGAKRSLSASSNQLFEVPFASQSAPPAEFQLVDNRGRQPRISKSSSTGSRRSGVPLNIVTQGIQPKDVKVSWKRVRSKEYQPQLEAR